MIRNRSFWRQLIVIGLVAVCWILLFDTLLAAEEGGGEESKLKSQPFVLPYILVLLSIGLGVFLVCFSSKRRDRPLGAAEFKDEAAAILHDEMKVPTILMGMREAKVSQMLGKPKIRRKGEEIFAELAQSGQLPEEEAAKVHAIYEHPAGRYELVFLDRRVVEIKKQPSGAKPDEAH
jgi:hypothetical protein